MVSALPTKQYVPQSLRDYQRGAVDAIKTAWASGTRAPLAALATGAGKTTVKAQLLVETVDPAVSRALVVAHTREIVEQIYNRVSNQFAGRLDEFFGLQPGIGIVMGEQDVLNARIVIATRQSLHKSRLLAILKSGRFDVLAIDEAHHAVADNTYGAIVRALRAANPDLRIVGFTATPKRTDRKALKTVFDDIVYTWLIPDGIATGYLTPVTRLKVSTKVNLSSIRSSGGDYTQDKMISALETSNWVDLCVTSYMDHIASTERQCLAFLPSVAMSKVFAVALQARGVAAVHLDGTTPKVERQKILSDYARGNVRCVSNMAVLTEGFDAPATSAIFLGRPTRSQTLFTQIVGRGLRPFPGKADCLLLDMTVVDTKALEVGTLLGRLIQCKACGTDYYFGLDKCPTCGADKPAPEKGGTLGAAQLPMNDVVGGELVATYEGLFAKAFAAWYMGGDGYLSCGLGFDNGTLVIAPPIVDEFYRLCHCPTNRDEPVKFIDMNEDLASLMLEADRLIQKNPTAARTSDKDASWRTDFATPAQMRLLRQLRVETPKTISRGLASQMITHALNVKRAMGESWAI